MSSATQEVFAKDAWQSPRNARTLRAYMALRNQEIASRVRELRKLKGNPPQERVAEALGVGDRTYQTWESGEAKPSYRNLQKLAEYFGVSESYILEGLDDRSVRGVPEQLEGVSAQFSVRVDQVEAALELITDLLRRQSAILERIEALVLTLPSDDTTQRLIDELRGRGAA
jgi:transcriptional regulator with XRE-family HTH domain